MGGDFGRDLAAVGLGVSQAINEQTLSQLFRRREQEESSLRQVSATLAETGQLHLLPPELTQGIQKRAGKDLFGVLNELSLLKEQELAPRRQAQSDFLSLINAPVQTQPALPGGSIGISPPQQAPQIQGGAPIQQAAAPPSAPLASAGNLALAPQALLRADEPVSGQQVRQIEPDIDPNPAQLEIVSPSQGRRSRAATPTERTERINNLSPIGVALAFSDNALGQLQVQSQQIANSRGKLELDRSIQALKQFSPKYATSFEAIDSNGRRVRSALFYMPDGTTQTVPLARGAGGGRAQNALTALQAIEDKLRSPRITESERGQLEQDRTRQEAAFAASLQAGGTKIDLPEPLENILSADGQRYLGTIKAGDDVSRRDLQRRDRARQIGSNKEIERDRSTLFEGRNAIAMIDDILGVATAENVGLVGGLRRGAQSLASLGRTAPRAFSSLTSLIGVARGEFANAESRAFSDRLVREFDASPDFVDATTKALAVVLAKVRDPNSVVREAEYDNALAQLEGSGGLFGSGFPGFKARIEVARRDVIRRMRNSFLNLRNTEESIRALDGDPSAQIPLINPSLDLPPEVSDPRFTGNVPGRPGIPQLPGSQGVTQGQVGAQGTIGARAPRATGLTPEQAQARAAEAERLINNELSVFGLQAIPQTLIPQMQQFLEANPSASGQAIVGAFKRLLNTHAAQNNLQRRAR